jgi:hypothetical protein
MRDVPEIPASSDIMTANIGVRLGIMSVPARRRTDFARSARLSSHMTRKLKDYKERE